MFELNNKYREQFYQEQNIKLRKQMRELDMRINYKIQGERDLSQYCNFLVLGPRNSGKTSLLRSLQFALNGSQGWGTQRRGDVLCVQIKRGLRWSVQGVQELKETDRNDEKPSIRYKRALEYVESGPGGCMQNLSEKMSQQLARVCLVCVSCCAELTHQEATYLKFLRVDLAERYIKILFLMTKTDELANRLSESQQFMQLDERIAHLMSQLDIHEREDIYCLQSYRFQEEQRREKGSQKKLTLNELAESQMRGSKVHNSEEINFYLLQLLQRIVHESEEALKIRTLKYSKSFCGWS